MCGTRCTIHTYALCASSLYRLQTQSIPQALHIALVRSRLGLTSYSKQLLKRSIQKITNVRHKAQLDVSQQTQACECIQHVKAVLINIQIKYPDLTFKISENLDMRKWIGFANPILGLSRDALYWQMKMEMMEYWYRCTDGLLGTGLMPYKNHFPKYQHFMLFPVPVYSKYEI